MPLARWFWLSVLFVVVALVRPTTSSTYPDSHPPFPFNKSVPYRTLKAKPVIDYKPGEFREGQLRIVLKARTNTNPPTLEVWQGNQKVLDTVSAHPEDDQLWWYGSRVYYVDLNGDGRKDILIYTNPGGNGLSDLMELADFLIAKADGTYSHLAFEAYAGGPEDFIDINGDGRYEMLWVNFYSAGGADQPFHSYWVYRVIEIQDDGLRLHDALIPEYPKIIWFTEKPNDQPTTRLTAVEREALIKESTAKWQETYR